MSAVVKDTKTELQERNTDVTERLLKRLGMDKLKAGEIKILSLIVMEAATEEMLHNSDFARIIKEEFYKTVPPKPTKPTRATTKKHTANEKSVEEIELVNLNPYQTTDPYILLQAYGVDHLYDRLKGYSLKRLNEISALVQSRNPGTSPKKKTSKEDVLDYIVRYVSAENHSSN